MFEKMLNIDYIDLLESNKLTLGLILLTVALIWFSFLWTYQYSYRNYPPGPFRIPFIGNFVQAWFINPKINVVKIAPWITIDKMSQVYGDVFSITFGNFYSVMLCSYESMVQVLNLDDWSNKISNNVTMTRTFDQELGLIFVGKYEIWHEMRKFSQKTLRDFGFGKRLSMQSLIENEIGQIINQFEIEADNCNGIITIKNKFTISLLNILWAMIAGQSYPHDDPVLKNLVQINFLATKDMTFGDPITLFSSWLRVLLIKSRLTNSHYAINGMHTFSKKLIDDAKKNGNYLENPESYIDVFLKNIEETKKDPSTIYTELQLQAMIEDFFQVGTTTTTGTLEYAILFMILNPQIQAKVQAEIDSIVPRHLIPTLDEIEKKMNYTMATLAEIHRLACIVPIPIPREIKTDIKYRNWNIPKGTIILSNHYSVMMDKKYWGDPECFRPERFLSENGEYIPDKRCVQFGFGKRYCIGVTLVNSIFPIYFTTLLQKFTFSPVDLKNLPSTEPEIGVSSTPFPFKAKITTRK